MPAKKPKTKAAAKSTEPEGTGMSAFGEIVAQWRADHRLDTPQWYVHPATVAQPSDALAVREKKEHHVAVLMKSFCDAGTVNESIEAVSVSDVLWKKKQQGQEITVEEWLSSCEGSEGNKPMVFSGAHSREACENLAKTYPRGHWKKMPIRAYVAPVGPETDRMIRIMGNLLNRKNQVYMNQEFAQIVLAMHAHLVDLYDKTMGDGEDSESRKKWQKLVAEYKSDQSLSLGIPTGSVTLIAQLAKHGGVLWNLIKAVVTGDYVPKQELDKKGKPKAIKNPSAPGKAPEVKSAHHFVALMGMSDGFMKKMLRQVVNGELSVAEMSNMTKSAKARYRLQNETIEHLQERTHFRKMNLRDVNWQKEQVKKHKKVEEDCNPLWIEACETYPTLEKLVEHFVPEVKKLQKKDPIPQDFFERLNTLITAASKKQQVKIDSVFYRISLILITAGQERAERPLRRHPVQGADGDTLPQASAGHRQNDRT